MERTKRGIETFHNNTSVETGDALRNAAYEQKKEKLGDWALGLEVQRETLGQSYQELSKRAKELRTQARTFFRDIRKFKLSIQRPRYQEIPTERLPNAETWDQAVKHWNQQIVLWSKQVEEWMEPVSRLGKWHEVFKAADQSIPVSERENLSQWQAKLEEMETKLNKLEMHLEIHSSNLDKLEQDFNRANTYFRSQRTLIDTYKQELRDLSASVKHEVKTADKSVSDAWVSYANLSKDQQAKVRAADFTIKKAKLHFSIWNEGLIQGKRKSEWDYAQQEDRMKRIEKYINEITELLKGITDEEKET